MVSDIKNVSFPVFENQDSFLVVYEDKRITFSVPRLFIVKANEITVRGFHAHIACSQLLIVLKGECCVLCDDGKSKKKVIMNKPSEGLLIPPTIWSVQSYESDTILMVLTDMPYDESDYLRDYNKFLNFRRGM